MNKLLFIFCLIGLVFSFENCKTVSNTEVSIESDNTEVELADVRIEGRKLNWTDYKGVVNENLSHEAYTLWRVYYKYDIIEYKGDTALLDVNVWRTFDQNSWRKTILKSDSIELLNHEQGHYDIAKLCVDSLQNAFEQNFYLKSNYGYKIDSIYWHVLNEHIQLEKRYDFETNHFFNKKNQKKWNMFFQKKVHNDQTED